MVEISSRLNKGGARVLAKVEFFNPAGSVKDRAALAMVENAEKNGFLSPGMTIVEPTSGNTGIALALVSAIKGYKLILVMPETMSLERRRLASAYGAEIVLTPGEKGVKGAVEEACKMAADCNYVMLKQFENPVNPESHYCSTGPEIWDATAGDIDAFIAGVGTGGTFTGTARYLKEKNPSIRFVAVEPENSAVLSGGSAGAHGLQGIGAGFVPAVMDVSLVSEVVRVTDEEAVRTARDAVAKEGLLVGISSGAALHAALNLSRRPDFNGKTIVVLLPDTGERYLSTGLFD
jgi:cysteine synthase A